MIFKLKTYFQHFNLQKGFQLFTLYFPYETYMIIREQQLSLQESDEH
jgi:hypothetical protein